MVSAFLYGNEFGTVESKIPNYEILPVEPCHDIPGHIKNIYDELPHHLVKEEKEILEYAITTSFNKKDTKRSVDYRKSIIIVTAYCRDKICFFAQELLETMVNIQMLLYADENKRTPIYIYGLNNCFFTLKYVKPLLEVNERWYQQEHFTVHISMLLFHMHGYKSE